ncbi:hypothetical protein TWF217_006791 [Orbilia oligospora]|nr:hypothetical protein TWF217_006791 [Orbilia oligospora]
MASLSVEYAPQYRWDSRRDFVAVGTAIHYIALQDNIWDGMELALTSPQTDKSSPGNNTPYPRIELINHEFDSRALEISRRDFIVADYQEMRRRARYTCLWHAGNLGFEPDTLDCRFEDG